MRTIVFLFLWFLFLGEKNELIKSEEGTVSFFSVAPIENIDATSNHVVSVINSSTNEIAFSVSIRSFSFKNKKMEEDFNEDFMDTEKYPVANYKGKINEAVDWKKEGTYKITAKGVLMIRGVNKERVDTAIVTVKNGKAVLSSEFRIRVADHKIKIPKILFEKIAEVVLVKLKVNYSSAKLAQK